MDNLHPFCHL